MHIFHNRGTWYGARLNVSNTLDVELILRILRALFNVLQQVNTDLAKVVTINGYI